MDTVLQGRSKTVVIGSTQPFCIIGERINPTGRKKFAEELRNDDLSTVVADTEAQMAAGADVLDVNAGIPLVDEAELLAKMLQLVQQHTDAPICIDSSVIEALEAGLAVYEGKPLVNSVTGEDERLEEILPLVARHGAAVIGLANDETGIPETAQQRLEIATKIVSVAGDHGIPPEDVVIDPLAMTVGADTEAVTTTLEAIRLIRDNLGVNMCLGASNVSFGLPRRHELNAGVHPDGRRRGPDERDHEHRADHRRPDPRRRPAARPRPVGLELDRRAPRPGEGGRGGVTQEVAAPAGTERARLRFEPEGAEVRVPNGTPVFDAASWNGIAIDSTCGGHGTCKKCKVRVREGELPVSSVDPRAFTADELRDGWRLACRAPAHGELVIEVPPLQTRPKAALAGVGRHVILRPSVQKRHLVLTEPTMEDQRSDFERMQDALEDLAPHAGLPVLRTLGRVLRRADWDVTAVVCDEELIDVEPGDTTARRFAIAFDLGTTTVVATLLDLETGTPAAVRSMLNRQQPFGADVITRISATMMDEGALDTLQARAQETLAQLTEEVCAEARVDPGEVYEITLCGNVTMTQLALGIDPEPLSMAPFVVTTHNPPALAASDFGVPVHPRAPAFAFPSLGAYVGGDIVAGMLATGLTRDRRLRLFIDVGTNSEIALGNQDRVVATAAPAGPAFEAAQIRCGMRAADGAIEGVKIADGELTLEVIGDVAPVGMCGSGLVDCVAELVHAGLLDHSGRYATDEVAAEVAPGLADRLTFIGKERVFVMAWRGSDPADSIFLSQRDVRELQFAKASIATGWTILLEELGATAADVGQVLLAGSFGAYLSPASAIRIGLVPRMALPRIVSAGNVAGEGAKIAALSLRERAEAEAIVREVRYVELSGRTDFNDRFIDQLAFPG